MNDLVGRARASRAGTLLLTTLALVVKEVREHWFLVAITASLVALGGFLILFKAATRGDDDAALEVLHALILVFGVPSAVVLGNRLLVHELRSRTQLFLEALPVRRGHVLLVKYAVGLSALLALFTACLVVSVLQGVTADPITARQLVIAGSRGAGFLWCTWSVCFVLGLLGRYRHALVVGAVLVLFFLDVACGLSPGRFGPFALMDCTFAHERAAVPWVDLAWTTALSAGLSLGGFGLGLLREGSVAAQLSRSMSQREKLTIAALVVGALAAAVFAEERAEPDPSTLPGGYEVCEGQVTVQVLGVDAELAADLARELDELNTWLGYDEELRVFVMGRRDLEPDQFLRGECEVHDDLMVRTASEPDRPALLRWMVAQVVLDATSDRAVREDKAWVLDGMGAWWETRDRADRPLISDPRWARRVAYALPDGPPDLDAWFLERWRLGEELTEAVGWSALRTVSHLTGPAAFQSFVRSTMHPWPHPGLLPMVVDRHCDTWCRLERASGLSRAAFHERWARGLRSARAAHAVQVEGVPRLRARLRTEPISSVDRHLVVEMEADPWPAKARVEVRHAVLEDLGTWTDTPDRDRLFLAPGLRLHRTVQRGERVGVEVAYDDPVLGAEVVAGWRTWEVP